MSGSKVAATALISCLGLIVCSSRAEARPDYNKTFWMQYAGELAAQAGVKCVVCHVGEDKKNRNDYGKAVGEALLSKEVGGMKNEKNVDKIKAALKKAEAGKSAVDGKTFGDLIKEGKLPASKP